MVNHDYSSVSKSLLDQYRYSDEQRYEDSVHMIQRVFFSRGGYIYKAAHFDTEEECLEWIRKMEFSEIQKELTFWTNRLQECIDLGLGEIPKEFK